MVLFKRFLWMSAGFGAIALGVGFVDNAAPGPPAIRRSHPASGPPGTVVEILGSGFSEASLVTFAGTRAEFSLGGASAIRAKVPGGAASGPVSVTTPLGTATSATPFRVIHE
jgi:hypothetical protein